MDYPGWRSKQRESSKMHQERFCELSQWMAAQILGLYKKPILQYQNQRSQFTLVSGVDTSGSLRQDFIFLSSFFIMKLHQVSENCFAVENEKNRVCDASSGLINLGGGVVIDTQSDLSHARQMITLFGTVWPALALLRGVK